MRGFALALGLALTIGFAQAQDASRPNSDQEALKNTQDMLRDAKARDAAIQQTGERARQVDQGVRNLAGSQQNADDIYGLAADVFANITKEAGGDPEKMQKLLNEAQKNPAAFAEKWTPEQKQKLGEIGTKIPTPSTARPSNP